MRRVDAQLSDERRDLERGDLGGVARPRTAHADGGARRGFDCRGARVVGGRRRATARRGLPPLPIISFVAAVLVALVVAVLRPIALLRALVHVHRRAIGVRLLHYGQRVRRRGARTGAVGRSLPSSVVRRDGVAELEPVQPPVRALRFALARVNVADRLRRGRARDEVSGGERAQRGDAIVRNRRAIRELRVVADRDGVAVRTLQVAAAHRRRRNPGGVRRGPRKEEGVRAVRAVEQAKQNDGNIVSLSHAGVCGGAADGEDAANGDALETNARIAAPRRRAARRAWRGS